MATLNWHRCLKSTFYRRAGLTKRLDHRKNSFDKAYVDPIDLVMIHTVPGDSSVDVLRWQVESFTEESMSDLTPPDHSLLLSWSERVAKEMEDETEETWGRRKEALLDNLDVDAEARDQLLSAIERFVFGLEADTTFRQQRVPQSDEALKGILFHFGVGPC